jgi:hypothetical protein
MTHWALFCRRAARPVLSAGCLSCLVDAIPVAALDGPGQPATGRPSVHPIRRIVSCIDSGCIHAAPLGTLRDTATARSTPATTDYLGIAHMGEQSIRRTRRECAWPSHVVSRAVPNRAPPAAEDRSPARVAARLPAFAGGNGRLRRQPCAAASVSRARQHRLTGTRQDRRWRRASDRAHLGVYRPRRTGKDMFQVWIPPESLSLFAR